MPTGIILLLGAFAGLTIFLGLPLVFLKQLPPSLKVFLNMLATGILMFLLFDVLSTQPQKKDSEFALETRSSSQAERALR